MVDIQRRVRALFALRMPAGIALVLATVVVTLAACGGAPVAKVGHQRSANRSVRWLLNARILDPEARTERVGHLQIKDGRIAQVVRQRPAHPGPNSLDLGGAWLLPAFVDLHVHSWGNPSPIDGPDHACGHAQTARLMLYAGVIAYLDLGSKPQAILRLRDQLRRPTLPGATLYAAGPVFGYIRGMKVPPTTPDVRLLQTPSPRQARAHVRALAKRHPDVIKVLMDHTTDQQNLSAASLQAIVAEAKRRKLRVICHIGTWQDARQCALAGVSAITHLWDEDDVPASLVRLLVAHHIPLIPTQPVQVDLPRYAGTDAIGWRDPLLRQLTPASLQRDYANTAAYVKKAKFWLRYQGPHRADYARQLATLYHGGVTLLAGSDTGNFGTFQGYSLHRELALMVAAGLPPWAALRAGTTAAGRFLGRRLGVRPGDEASFVVLRASPLVAIRHTQQIVEVIQRGHRVDRAGLLLGTSLGGR